MDYVVYYYTISIIFITFYRSSKTYKIVKGKSKIIPGLKYSIISFFFGWWGIPAGPIKTIQSFIENFSGGKNITTQYNEYLYDTDEPEGIWNCPVCNHENINTEYRCSNCD